MLTRLSLVLPKSTTWTKSAHFSQPGVSKPSTLAQSALLRSQGSLSIDGRIHTFNACQPLNTIQLRGIRFVKKKKALVYEAPAADTRADDAAELIKQYKKALIIDETGTNLGVVFVTDAWAQAKSRGLSMVKVRDGDIPVLRFEQFNAHKGPEKEDRSALKDPSSDALHDRMKEVRISDHISEHDLQVKVGKARHQLLSKYKVRFDMRFKRRFEFDPVLAQMTMENIYSRLEDVAHIESPFKVNDTGSFMVLKPHSRKSLIAEGHIQIADPEESKEPTRRQIQAAKRQKAALEKEELRAQGVKFKKYLTPEEQIRQSSTNGDEHDVPKPKVVVVEDEDDRFSEAALAERFGDKPPPSRRDGDRGKKRVEKKEEEEDDDDDFYDDDDEDDDDDLLDDIMPKKSTSATPIPKGSLLPIAKPAIIPSTKPTRPIPGKSTGSL